MIIPSLDFISSNYACETGKNSKSPPEPGLLSRFADQVGPTLKENKGMALICAVIVASFTALTGGLFVAGAAVALAIVGGAIVGVTAVSAGLAHYFYPSDPKGNAEGVKPEPQPFGAAPDEPEPYETIFQKDPEIITTKPPTPAEVPQPGAPAGHSEEISLESGRVVVEVASLAIAAGAMGQLPCPIL